MRNVTQILLNKIPYQTCCIFGAHNFQCLNIKKCCLNYLTKQAHSFCALAEYSKTQIKESFLTSENINISIFPKFIREDTHHFSSLKRPSFHHIIITHQSIEILKPLMQTWAQRSPKSNWTKQFLHYK